MYKKRGENIIKAIQSISKSNNDLNTKNLSLFTTKGDLLNITISKYTDQMFHLIVIIFIN